MSKRSKRWPIWRIAVSGISCVLGAGAVFCLGVYLDKLGVSGGPEQDTTQVFALPGFFMMLGMGVFMLAVVCFIWLGLRIKEARTPPWERKGKSRRR